MNKLMYGGANDEDRLIWTSGLVNLNDLINKELSDTDKYLLEQLEKFKYQNQEYIYIPSEAEVKKINPNIKVWDLKIKKIPYSSHNYNGYYLQENVKTGTKNILVTVLRSQAKDGTVTEETLLNDVDTITNYPLPTEEPKEEDLLIWIEYKDSFDIKKLLNKKQGEEEKFWLSKLRNGPFEDKLDFSYKNNNYSIVSVPIRSWAKAYLVNNVTKGKQIVMLTFPRNEIVQVDRDLIDKVKDQWNGWEF